MQFSIDRDAFISALATVEPATDVRSTIPACHRVLLEAGGDSLRLTGTDLQLTVTTSARCEAKKSGSYAIGGRALLDRLRAMPPGEVQVAERKGKLVVSHGASKRRFEAACVPGDEQPGRSKAPDYKAGIAAGCLRGLIARAAYAMSSDQTRPALASLRLEVNGSKWSVAATDGHRLAYATAEDATLPGAVDVLVPAKCIARLLAATKGCEETVEIAVNQSEVFFVFDSAVISARMPDAQFPPYQQVIPNGNANAVEVSRDALIETLQAVSVSSDRMSMGVKLEMTGGVLRVFAESAELGNAVDEIGVDYHGDPVRIGFNARYMIDALKAMGDAPTIRFGGDLDPILVESEGTVAVVMPCRL